MVVMVMVMVKVRVRLYMKKKILGLENWKGCQRLWAKR
jgi:hypothetical protein